jgi:FtsP/CotA-like multicopper oxidase with cupredoxin domain
MHSISLLRVFKILISIIVLIAAANASPGAEPAAATASIAIRANDNRVPAGKLQSGVLTLHLELTSGDWYPEADDGSSMQVDALAEEGKAPQVPGPLIRVPQGTEIHATFHNLLPKTALIYGMHKRPGDPKDTVEVPSGETLDVRFSAGEPGTYQYFASAGGEMYRGRPFREDSQMHGAFIVDPAGSVASDRVFVIGAWRNQTLPTLSNDVAVINGKSWPYTERLTYAAGEEVRWRWINASDLYHPMHMHGSYYRVDSTGDGERDQMFSPEQQRMGVTRLMPPGSTMTTFWSPVAGRWLFHCHTIPHIAPRMTVANAHAPAVELIHGHGPNHMAGLVLGITVTGNRPKVVAHGHTRKLRLLVRERPPANGLPAGFGYQLVESHRLLPNELSALGPPLVLERGRRVEITVVNQLHEPTAVHWHGMELQSYYDGVAGWGMHGRDVTPAIEPGHSFRVRFTPPRSGTFIYHTHMDDEVQLAGGLYGPLVVIDPGARFDATSDQIFVLSSRGGRASGDPKAPLCLLLNGAEKPVTLHWRAGQQYRIRLINISSASLGSLSLTGPQGFVQWRARAKDGADLPASQAVMQEARQVISSGETYDFEYQPSNAQSLTLEFQTLLLQKTTQQIDVQ